MFVKFIPILSLFCLSTITGYGMSKKTNQTESEPESYFQECPAPCCPEPCCPQPCPENPAPCIFAVNACDRIPVQCPWGVWIDASYIYWHPSQSNMEVALTELQRLASNSIGTVFTKTINLDTDYKSGFQVGLGWNIDRDCWDLSALYTRFHSTHSQSDARTPLSNGTNDLIPLWGDPLLTFGFTVGAAQSGSVGATSLHSTWRLNMDFIDLDLGRKYYVGQYLSFRPSFGFRAGWIDQKRSQHAVNDINTAFGTGNVMNLSASSDSWGVGFRTALNMKWDLGHHFRFYGDAGGDLLYTRYKNHMLTEVIWGAGNRAASTPPPAGSSAIANSPYRSKNIRPHFDLDAGFGWGMLFASCGWYLDLSADYNFQIFFNQNMFRWTPIVGASVISNGILIGDLYIHGLTFTAKLEF